MGCPGSLASFYFTQDPFILFFLLCKIFFDRCSHHNCCQYTQAGNDAPYAYNRFSLMF